MIEGRDGGETLVAALLYYRRYGRYSSSSSNNSILRDDGSVKHTQRCIISWQSYQMIFLQHNELQYTSYIIIIFNGIIGHFYFKLGGTPKTRAVCEVHAVTCELLTMPILLVEWGRRRSTRKGRVESGNTNKGKFGSVICYE